MIRRRPAPTRRLLATLAAAVTLAFLMLGVAATRSVHDLALAREESARLTEKVASAEQRVRGLEHRLEGLREDPETLERIARDDLGLVRSDDIVIVYE